ncbi:GAF domain-containing protein [bacterium]|nr:GAF domain-containing protein [bacterium]
MTRYFSSLRARLIVLVLLATMPVAGLSIWIAAQLRGHERVAVEQGALHLAKDAAGVQERMVGSAHQLLEVLALLPQVRTGDTNACNTLFAELLQENPRYVNFGLTDAQGWNLSSAVPLTQPVSSADTLWFQRVRQTGQPAVGEYQIGRITGKPSLHFGQPLLNDRGQLRGVIYAALGLDWINQLLVQAELPPGATRTVLDHRGMVLARHPYPEEWVGQSVTNQPLFQALQQTPTRGALAELVGLDGQPQLYAWMRLSRATGMEGVSVAVGIPRTVAFAGSRALLRQHLLGLGLVTVMTLAFAWFGGDVFVRRRIMAVINAARRLQAGDPGARSLESAGGGELAELGHAFNEMADTLERREADRQRAEEVLRKSEARLSFTLQTVQIGAWDLNLLDQTAQRTLIHDRIFGYETLLPSWTYETFLEHVLPEDRPEVDRRLREADAVQTDWSIECRIRRADGEVRWIWVAGCHGRNSAGKTVRLSGIVQDITDRKRAEDEVRRTNRALRAMSECSQILVRAANESELLQEICRIVVEVGDYRLAWVGLAETDEAKTVRPVAQAGYEGGYLETLRITGADTERGRGPTGTAIRTGRPTIVRQILTDPNYSPWRADAVKRGYGSSAAFPLLADGTPFGALNIYASEPDAFDVEELNLLGELAEDLAYGIGALRTRAERQRMEAALQESEAQFRQMAEAMPQGVWTAMPAAKQSTSTKA